ncbi:MAG: hypothetical protein ACXVPN_04540 [Bacteroidia bacterium]
MKVNNFKKQIVLALAPLLILCAFVFANWQFDYFSNAINGEGNSTNSIYNTEETPLHEPVYVSVFKFIVNCNPFQKESQF